MYSKLNTKRTENNIFFIKLCTEYEKILKKINTTKSTKNMLS